MKRQIACLMALLIMGMALIPVQVLAAGTFSDVEPSHWGASYIAQCYDLGLMVGTAETTFSPAGTLTVAQAVTTAVRIHDYCTGDQTEIVQDGVNWYDGYVRAAIKLKIMSDTEFDSYTRSATRAELAGLLGKALPKKALKAINSVKELPDVDVHTPYADEIFKLYEAGVITGSDKYGTFSPYQNISRVELATLLCRLAKEDTRKTFTLLEKPADTTARTTNCRLVIAGVPVYGVVEIDKQFYIPIGILDDRNVLPERMVYLNEYTDRITLEIHPENLKEGQSMIAQAYTPTPGMAMGLAEPSDLTLIYHKKEIENALYMIDGRYSMVSLEKIGAKREGNDFILHPNGAKGVEIVEETDLIGSIPAQLKKSTTRETVIAVHDYIVNTLKYDPRVSQVYTTEAEMQKVETLWTDAEAKYQYENNLALATGYGVCQHYAELFQAFCTRLGIASCYVSGNGNGGSHGWNAVYVDGTWLYVDCTFDDPVGKTQTLLRDYCLVGPDKMAIKHAWRGADYPMPAEYDPMWEQLDSRNITSADMFRKCLIAQMMQKKTSFSLRTVKSGAYGGVACVYKFNTGFYYMSSYYNKTTGAYDFTVEYW